MNYDQLLAKLKVDLAPQLQAYPATFWGWVFSILGALALLILMLWLFSIISQFYQIWVAMKQGEIGMIQAYNEQRAKAIRNDPKLAGVSDETRVA